MANIQTTNVKGKVPSPIAMGQESPVLRAKLTLTTGQIATTSVLEMVDIPPGYSVMFVGWVAPLPGALAVLVPDERDELADGALRPAGSAQPAVVTRSTAKTPPNPPWTRRRLRGRARGRAGAGTGGRGGIREGSSEWTWVDRCYRSYWRTGATSLASGQLNSVM